MHLTGIILYYRVLEKLYNTPLERAQRVATDYLAGSQAAKNSLITGVSHGGSLGGTLDVSDGP